MGMPLEPVQQVAQHVAQEPGVTWELFKWIVGGAFAYITGSYILTGGLAWKFLGLIREDRKMLMGEISKVRDNDVKHLEERVENLEKGCKVNHRKG